jgi:hypothetical protein
MFFVVLGISAVFLLIVNAIALSGSKRAVAEATVASWVFTALTFFLWTLLGMLNTLLVAIGATFCWMGGARPRRFVVSSLVATGTAYAIFTCCFVVPELVEWNRLKQDYPLESLAERLAYEDRRRPESGQGEEPTFNADHLNRLEKHFESIELTSGRRRSLEHLHAGVVKQFIDSNGFGVARMGNKASPYYLERRDESPWLRQPAESSPSADYDIGSLQSTRDAKLLGAHEYNTFDFLNAGEFGYARDREHVAGFRPHQFRRAPDVPERWQVRRLELVGLLKYDEPVVYLSSYFPRMDELSRAPTRPLDGFETEALEMLRRGEDLTVRESPRHLRMLGSIRAVEQCLRCHRVRRGELLGAFSYQLEREP